MIKKLLLLVLVSFTWNSFSQKQTQSIQTLPPPPGIRWEYGLDHDNDGYALFDITGYVNRFNADILNSNPPFNHNLSGYTFQVWAHIPNSSVLIATPIYTNTVTVSQEIEIIGTYSGSGPNYGSPYTTNNSHFLSTIPGNGDLDGDGISNFDEDLNHDMLLYDHNSDGDSLPNFWDSDDDGDGILTINEDYNGNGSALDDDMNTNGIPDYLDNTARGTLQLNLKFFIEGYYIDSGTMKSVKRNQDGISALTDVENVTVELHNTTAPYALVASTTGMLKTNGNVSCSFPTASVGSYYIAVKSNNCIETWSVVPQLISNVGMTYNFSDAANKAFANNMRNLGSGIYGFYSGDIPNGEIKDGFIDGSDYSIWEMDYNEFAFGIYTTDLNGDGFVDGSDYSIWEGNYNNFITAIKPE